MADANTKAGQATAVSYRQAAYRAADAARAEHRQAQAAARARQVTPEQMHEARINLDDAERELRAGHQMVAAPPAEFAAAEAEAE